jgi:nucleoside-diphosphate-sugar epimerase
VILVTGANGFVGGALLAQLHARRLPTRGVSRESAPGCTTIGSIDAATDWTEALADVHTVVHLAARVHVMRDTERDPLSAFRKANVEASLNLARQAARAGAKRFVFISSIKVNGELSRPGAPFRASDTPAPADPYGVSKREAEDGLLELGRHSGMEVVIIRPPLVYGPGVKANFLAMMRWLRRGLPLPFGAIHNRRTLVALDNLVDLIVVCLEHPAAANRIFLAGDAESLSTTVLLRRLAAALGTAPRLVPVPASLLETAAACLGKRSLAQRLCGNLELDISATRDLLAWRPPLSVDEGLRQAAQHFLAQQGR